MYLIIIIFALTFTLYLYLNRKIKYHDFHIANFFRPILHFLLFVSIELFIPIASYYIIKILLALTNNESVITLSGVAIAIMVIVPFFFPFITWRNKPLAGNSYALYLRSFRSDKGKQQQKMRSILSMIKCFYPIYAIGNPNETVSLFKRAIPIYKTDKEWQAAINEYKIHAKIILLNLDGTDGLIWETKNTINYLNKVLFVAEDEYSFNQFYNRINEECVDLFIGFPKPTSFPSIIWHHNDNWFIYDADYISNYVIEHPWQEKSVENVLNYIVQDTKTEQYGINRYKAFVNGCKDITILVKPIDRILFFLFPFNQQYYTVFHRGNNIISTIISIYLFGCVFFYYLSWFILPYCIYDPEGLTINNSRFLFAFHILLLTLPICFLSSINGPKSFWLTHSYMNQHGYRKKIYKNALMGFLTVGILLGLGWKSKLNQIQEDRERKEFYKIIGYNEEAINARKHIDSICIDVGASALLTGYIPAKEVHSGGIVNITYKYQQAIKDSLGTKEYYPSTMDSLMPDRWYSNIAWSIIKEAYHKD